MRLATRPQTGRAAIEKTSSAAFAADQLDQSAKPRLGRWVEEAHPKRECRQREVPASILLVAGLSAYSARPAREPTFLPSPETPAPPISRRLPPRRKEQPHPAWDLCRRPSRRRRPGHYRQQGVERARRSVRLGGTRSEVVKVTSMVGMVQPRRAQATTAQQVVVKGRRPLSEQLAGVEGALGQTSHRPRPRRVLPGRQTDRQAE